MMAGMAQVPFLPFWVVAAADRTCWDLDGAAGFISLLLGLDEGPGAGWFSLIVAVIASDKAGILPFSHTL